ncbi:CMRF35-like molecule 1 [Alosa sapidissima]|uniref:CMRF35-like molecule 1 n=1 Tax=Alosa sapidissima TaxID=34773 RepID=UPI001C0A2525|nr:CMRF35-like molecule 1 [Alosa sapidissima]
MDPVQFGTHTLDIKLLAVPSTGQNQKLQHTVGDSADITCDFFSKHANSEKFLCVGANRSTCTRLSDIRYSVTNWQNGRTFKATINNLVKADAGVYWCGFKVTLSSLSYTNLYNRTQLIITVYEDPSTYPGSPIIYLTTVVVVVMVVLVLGAVVFKLYRKRRNTPDPAASVNRSDNRWSIADYENDTARDDVTPPSIVTSPAYQNLNLNIMQQDPAYQSLNPNTMQPESVYQSLNPNTMQQDSIYQSLNPNTMQQDSAYENP